MTERLMLVDWLVLALPLAIIILIGIKTQKYMRGVAHFLAGGRHAGRYLVSVSAGEAGFGLISAVGLFEMWYRGGFAIGFWQQITAPVGMIMAVTGFAIYRYRQTRAMTIGQFFQMRYSRGVRMMAGVVAWVSGVLNFALFPAVGGRFVVHYLRLPITYDVLGVSVSTYGTVMAVFLLIALVVALRGGQITVMVTDCANGIFSYFGFTIVVIAILSLFTFDQFREAMMTRPPGQSFVNPFDTGDVSTFNILFVLIGVFMSIYSRLSWQGSAGYNCAAANPHEQKMAGILGAWRGGFQQMMLMLLLIAAFTLLNHPDFSSQAQLVHEELQQRIEFANPTTTDTIRNQMLVPVAIRHLLPIGIVGIFASLMILWMLSTDTTYMHAWGAMFVQDVLLPFKKKGFSPKTQILLLRLSIVGVAIFAWFFAMYFAQVTYILMFFQLTGTLYLGFAGSLIIGGLYWRRGTTAGAYTAMVLGVTGAITAFCLTQFWGPHIYPWWAVHGPDSLERFRAVLEVVGNALPIVQWEWSESRFPVSGLELAFLNTVMCLTSYLVVSLLTCRTPYNLDRMLHRGKYAVADGTAVSVEVERARPLWKKLTGITHEHTRGDRVIAWSVVIWALQAFITFLVVILLNLFVGRWGDEGFFLYWKYYQVGLSLFVGAITTVWFTWGGTRDLIRFFRALKDSVVNEADDGRVVEQVNLADVALVEKVEHRSIEEAHDATTNRDEEEKPNDPNQKS